MGSVINTILKKIAGEYSGDIPEPVSENGKLLKKIADNVGTGGDFFEIKIDWDNMTCNHSASEIRDAANSEKSFIGLYNYDWFSEESDAANNTATIIMWEYSSGNIAGKLLVNEDKTVEFIDEEYRLIPGEPIRIKVLSDNQCTYSATELKTIINKNKYKRVPFIYLIKDGYVYSLVFYQLDDAGTNDFFRFACVTDTAIKFAEISGDSNIVTFTDKSI